MIANQGYHLFDLHDEGRALVLGLSWQPLLGKDLAKNSRRIALAEKASHYVAGDNSCAAVGVINLRAEPSDPSRRDLYSAAAIFARENKQGVNIACVEIPDSEGQLVWVVACLDGVIIKGTDRVCSQQVAEHLLLELRTRYKFSMTRDVVLEKLGASVGFGRLEECKTTLQSIPGFAKIGFAAVLALLVCNAGFEKWKAYEAEKERENHIELHVDAQALWKAQLGNWAKTQKMDGPAGLSAIYQHIASTPIRVGNWQLAGVTLGETTIRS
jgi:hypothetical protein